MKLVGKYAGSSVNLTGSSLTGIRSKLNQKRPVVVWVTMHGFSVHAVTITGFDGENIYFNDPWTNKKNISMKTNDFLKTWKSQQNRAISY